MPTQAGSVVVLSSAVPCWVLNEGIFLAAGATVAVNSVLTFNSAAGNPTQNATAAFEIGVNLTDTAVSLPPTECGGAGISIPAASPRVGVLTNSGSDLPIMLISVTAFILGVGLFFVVAAWRRRREDDAETFGT